MVGIEAHACHPAQKGQRQEEPWDSLLSQCSPISKIHSVRDTLAKEVDFVAGWMMLEVYSRYHTSIHTCTEIYTYIYICTSHVNMHLYVHKHICAQQNIYTHALKCIDKSINHLKMEQNLPK